MSQEICIVDLCTLTGCKEKINKKIKKNIYIYISESKISKGQVDKQSLQLDPSQCGGIVGLCKSTYLIQPDLKEPTSSADRDSLSHFLE